MITPASFLNRLKTIYHPGQVQYMAFKKHPTLALISKNSTNFGGAAYGFAVEYGRQPGRSATFANAQANAILASGTRDAQFLVTRVSDYGIARITTEAMLASEKDNAAFQQAAKNAMERAIYGVSFSLAQAIWGIGAGNIGTIATNPVGAPTITLTNIEDSINFYPGQRLVATAAVGAGALRVDVGGLDGTITVLSVNHDTGVITAGVAAATNWSDFNDTLALGDTLYQEGDYIGGGAVSRISGIPAWVPAVAPGAGAFFNVNRTADPHALAGIRPNVAAPASIHEKLIVACGTSARLGAETDHIFMNPEDVSDLVLELEGRVQYSKVTSPKSKEVAQVSFDSIKFMTPMGAVDIVADQFVPRRRVWGLKMDTWHLGSLGGAPRVLAGLDDLIVNNQDAREIRIGYFGNLYCTAPGKNWTASIA